MPGELMGCSFVSALFKLFITEIQVTTELTYIVVNSLKLLKYGDNFLNTDMMVGEC